jgi:hypothetical protein
MTIHDEFLEILRVLAEDPRPSAKKPPKPGRSTTAPDISRERISGKRKEVAS